MGHASTAEQQASTRVRALTNHELNIHKVRTGATLHTAFTLHGHAYLEPHGHVEFKSSFHSSQAP